MVLAVEQAAASERYDKACNKMNKHLFYTWEKEETAKFFMK